MNDYVGCMVVRKQDEIFLHQTELIGKLEKEFENKLSDVKGSNSPTIAG